MSEAHERRIAWRRFIQAKLPEWTIWFQELIRTSSIFEHEHKISDLVEKYIFDLKGEAVSVYHDPGLLSRLKEAQPPISKVPGRRSLVARIRGKGNGRSLIIATHLDVVPPGDLSQWTHPPFSGHIDPDQNIIFGRGAMDDKAGVTISLALFGTIMRFRQDFTGEVIFHYFLEDETTGNGSLLCLEAGHRGDAALLIDGTRSDHAINEHAGQMRFRIFVKGMAAPFSVSHLGCNAAEVTLQLLLRLKEKVLSLNQLCQGPWRHLPSPFQFIIHRFRSEGAEAIIPDTAESECYVTFPPPFTLDKMRRVLEEEVDVFSAEMSLVSMPELEWIGTAIEPFQSNSPELEDMLQRTAACLRMPPIKVLASTGTSDLRHYCNAGIPCLLYGPGAGFNPHRPNEYYHLDDLERMILFYLELIYLWLNPEQTT